MAYAILAKDGRPIMKDGDPVRAMDVTVEKIEQLDEGAKSFIAVASTEDEDRDKDIIRQDGWDLKNFKKNPMVPWSHDYWGIPIAKSLKTWVDKTTKKLLFKPQFDEDDDTSMKIFNKYRKGFLKSFSVGFRGLKFEYRNEDDPWFGGMEFLQQELLEISAVTVPANPNATVLQNGVSNIQNMLQLGYPVKFAETKQGLFYPVREELGEFTNPELVVVNDKDLEGVQAVYANSISSIGEDGSFTDDPIPVGYYFDPKDWNTEDIKSWINDNTDKTYKFHYYNWIWIDDEKEDKSWEVEIKEEEKQTPQFDEPVPAVCPAPTDNDKSKDEDEEEDDNPDLDIMLEDEEEDADSINDSEKTLTNHLDKMTELFGKHLDAVSKGVEIALEKVFEGLSEIKLLLNEKTVDSDSQMDDNKGNDNLAPDEDNKDNSKSDDDIELDDSLFSPDNDKTNDDEMIELDDDLLSNKENAKTAVKSVFSERLKETLKEVKDSFKIEV
jgi:HK97 family phage prohead protease